VISSSQRPLPGNTHNTHNKRPCQRWDSNPQSQQANGRRPRDYSDRLSMKYKVKSKGVPRQAEVALGVPGRLRPRIISTFGTTRVVCRQPHAPAAFTPGEIPGTHFQRLSRPQGTWSYRKEPRKKSPVTPPGIDPGTLRLVAQRLNHYATPGPKYEI
jgi:hypothetical protein